MEERDYAVNLEGISDSPIESSALSSAEKEACRKRELKNHFKKKEIENRMQALVNRNIPEPEIVNTVWVKPPSKHRVAKSLSKALGL